MIGIIPAAGVGARIQPLACSKELLPVGAHNGNGAERPKAIAEYLVERMVAAGVEQICMVISPEKADMMRFFAEHRYNAEIFYVVQNKPQGLCDAIFRAEPFIRDHAAVLIGLPDTVWFPADAYSHALDFSASPVNLLLFPVEDASVFDAVSCDAKGKVLRVEVKNPAVESRWIWGAITATRDAMSELKQLWQRRESRDVYLGDLFNAFIAEGNRIKGVACGEIYLDAGTLEGYRQTQDFLRRLRNEELGNHELGKEELGKRRTGETELVA